MENRPIGALIPSKMYQDEQIAKYYENFVYRLPNGEIVAVYQDVTERKRAEKALQISEAQLSNAMEIAKLGYWEYDVAEDLFTFNDHFYSIFRTSAERVGGYQISSARYAQLFLHPDDRPLVAAEIKKSLETADPHFSRQLEHRIIYADGEPGYISVRFFIVKDKQGRTVKTFGANQDITEQKRPAEELRKMQKHLEGTVNALPDLMFEVDAQGRIYNYHTPTLQILYVPPEKFLNKTFRQVLPKDAADTIMRSIAAAAEKGYHRGATYSLKMPEGLCWFELSISVWGNPKSPECRFIVLVRDITERIKLEENLLRSREQLHKLTQHLEAVREEEQQRISRELHDELGQVLTALKIDVSWLKKRPAAFQDKAVSEKIHTMAELIDQTIETTKRISTALRPAILDDLGLIPAVEWQINEFTKHSGIKGAFSVTPPEIIVPPEIATAVFRILQESLTNILRYANATRVKISLNATGEQIELKVRDNGKGINKEKIKGPLSFGLIGMRERLYPFGGALDIKGRKGKGTTVSVVIPLRPSHKKEKKEE